jgi:hypothetical protein
MPSCNHPEPELCERLGFHLVGRMWQIWHGVNIDPEVAARYREMWQAQAASRPGRPPPQRPPRCPHLWRRARDAEGKVKTRWCKTG